MGGGSGESGSAALSASAECWVAGARPALSSIAPTDVSTSPDTQVLGCPGDAGTSADPGDARLPANSGDAATSTEPGGTTVPASPSGMVSGCASSGTPSATAGKAP